MTYRTQLVAWTLSMFGSLGLMGWAAGVGEWGVFAVAWFMVFLVWIWAKMLEEWASELRRAGKQHSQNEEGK